MRNMCQCEYADRSVPAPIIRIVMDNLLREANKVGRTDLIQELEERWDPYSRNPHGGTAAANMGAQLVMARYELFPNLCARNRMWCSSFYFVSDEFRSAKLVNVCQR